MGTILCCNEGTLRYGDKEMLNKNIRYILISAAIMILLPFIAVKLINGDAGMAVCFILFFAVNPLASIFMGIASGRNLRSHWFQPLLLAVLFILGTWIFFDLGEPAFLMYGAGYLLIGYVAALINAVLIKRKA